MNYTREQIEEAGDYLHKCGDDHYSAIIRQLLAENDALREDAERYVYLIEEHGYEMESRPGVFGFCSDKEVVDAAIDAARKKGVRDAV